MSHAHAIARDVFVQANGLGPWPCAYCGDPVQRIGLASDEGQVHHHDENPRNNAIENLRMMHHRCHARYHMKGEPKSEAHAAKVRVAHLGHPHTDEAKSKISQAKRGVNIHQTRIKCGDCDLIGNPGIVSQHQRAKSHAGRITL